MRELGSSLLGAARRLRTRRWLATGLGASLVFPVGLLATLRAAGAIGPLTDEEMAALYEAPLPPPAAPLRVFHLGHSLVGRVMPAMLAQLAPEGHGYESQLGWGTTLRAHFNPEEGINGFELENAHPRYRDAREAIGSGDYDAFVMTEMVEIRDAIRYFESATYLLRWAQLARAANPGIRLYLYETWHNLGDPEGWLVRLERDLDRHWIGEILRPALSADETLGPIHVIPAGQVLARFVGRLEAEGGMDGLRSREDLFGRTPEGEVDGIHLNDVGAYLVALTHFAVLYHRSPVGLPHELMREDGSPAAAPSPAAARAMQEVVWEVVSTTPMTGVAQAGSAAAG